MCVDDQSARMCERESDFHSIFSFFAFFVCVCDWSKHMYVKAFDKADTWAYSSTTGGLWVDQDKTSRPQGFSAAAQQKSIQRISIDVSEQDQEERKERGWLLWCFRKQEESKEE